MKKSSLTNYLAFSKVQYYIPLLMWKLGLDSKTAKPTVSKQDWPSITPTGHPIRMRNQQVLNNKMAKSTSKILNKIKWPNQQVLNKIDHQYSVTVMEQT